MNSGRSRLIRPIHIVLYPVFSMLRYDMTQRTADLMEFSQDINNNLNVIFLSLEGRMIPHFPIPRSLPNLTFPRGDRFGYAQRDRQSHS